MYKDDLGNTNASVRFYTTGEISATKTNVSVVLSNPAGFPTSSSARFYRITQLR
jgi:hypothetical protein